MEEKELWMNKLKEKLEDYSEPIPASGWEQLEKERVGIQISSCHWNEALFGRYGRRAFVLLVSGLSIDAPLSPIRNESAQTRTGFRVVEFDQLLR